MSEVATLHVARGSACNQQKEMGTVSMQAISLLFNPQSTYFLLINIKGKEWQIKCKCCKINDINLSSCVHNGVITHLSVL